MNDKFAAALQQIKSFNSQAKIFEALGAYLVRTGVPEPTDEQKAEVVNKLMLDPELVALAAVKRSPADSIAWFKERKPAIYEDWKGDLKNLQTIITLELNAQAKVILDRLFKQLVEQIAPSDVTVEDCYNALTS